MRKGHRFILVVLLVLLWISAPLAASAGRVITRDGSPVTDATVTILGLTGAVTTDADGRFQWRPDPKPPFEILVVLNDGRYLAPVLVSSIPEQGDWLIEVEAVQAAEVSVTATVTPNIEGPPASGMSTIGSEEIARSTPVRVADAVKSIPGVYYSSDLHTAVPTIRGFARGRTLILLDGGRVTAERRAGPSAGFVSPFSLEGIEVSRGPGSVAYGSDAFGGVIHLRTRRPEAGSGFHARVMGTLASGLPEKSAALEFSQGFEEGGVLVQGYYRDFDDFDSRRGLVDNSGTSDRGFLARFQHEVGGGIFSLGWQSDYARSIGRPSTRNPSRRTFYPEETSHRFTFGYASDPVGGFSRLSFEGFLGSISLLTSQDFLPTSDSPRDILQSDIDAGDYGFRFVANRPMGNGRIEFGLDFNGRFGLQAIDREIFFDASDRPIGRDSFASVEDARRNDYGFYLTGETALAEWLTGSAGVRYDAILTRNVGGGAGDVSTDNDAVSGFAALTASLSPGWSLTGQVARGFRDPTLSDRYFTGISGRGFITGNPDLRPEESLQYDAALRYTADGFRFGLFFYHYRIFGLIERFEADDDQFFFRNRGQARQRGAEIVVQKALSRGYVLDAGFQFAQGYTRGDGLAVDDIPPESFTLAVTKPFGPAYLRLDSALFLRDEDPGPGEIDVPSYALFDLAGGVRVGRGQELRVSIHNIFDKDYPFSPDSRALAGPGRSARLTLAFTF